MQNEPAKCPMINVNSLDCKGNRVLACLSHGQIWEFTITSRLEKVDEEKEIASSASFDSSVSDIDFTKNKLS